MIRIKIILQHIKEDALEIQEFVQGLTLESFIDNKMVRKAVCMFLINIGELVKALPEDFKKDNQEIPWKKVAGWLQPSADPAPI